MRSFSAPTRTCAGTRGFLGAVDDLILRALAGTKTPASLCYVYNARDYTLELAEWKRVDQRTVSVRRKDGTRLEAVWKDLIAAEFIVANDRSEETKFELLIGGEGDLRGIPVQIVYQPNFWFRIELNLDRSGQDDTL